MNIMDIPQVIEDIILDYVSQLEHSEKFSKVLEEIRNIEYTNNQIDNCCRFTTNIYNSPRERIGWRTYHIRFCRQCNNYYRSSVFMYDFHRVNHYYRYTYYNTFLNDAPTDYVLTYQSEEDNWLRQYSRRHYIRDLHCSCLREIWLDIM